MRRCINVVGGATAVAATAAIFSAVPLVRRTVTAPAPPPPSMGCSAWLMTTTQQRRWAATSGSGSDPAKTPLPDEDDEEDLFGEGPATDDLDEFGEPTTPTARQHTGPAATTAATVKTTATSLNAIGAAAGAPKKRAAQDQAEPAVSLTGADDEDELEGGDDDEVASDAKEATADDSEGGDEDEPEAVAQSDADDTDLDAFDVDGGAESRERSKLFEEQQTATAGQQGDAKASKASKAADLSVEDLEVAQMGDLLDDKAAAAAGGGKG